MNKKLLALLAALTLLAGCSAPASPAASTAAESSAAASVQLSSDSSGSADLVPSGSSETSSPQTAVSSAPEIAPADGTMTVRRASDSPAPGRTETLTLDASGEIVLLLADGPVENVRLSSVRYNADGSFTETGEVWAAQRLEDGCGLLLTTVIPESAPNLRLSWDGAGGTQTRYLTESGKDGSLLLADLSASAETGFLPVEITSGLPYSCDLDGDGEKEQISLFGVAYDKDDNLYLHLQVFDQGSILLDRETKIGHDPSLWLADLNSDGRPEIYLSGDLASDDFVTYGWTLDRGLESIAFTGDERPFTLATELFADGRVAAASGGELTLRSATDLLGSYWGTRNYTFNDAGVLAPVPDTLWLLENGTYLRTTAPLPVTLDGKAASLPAGTELRLTATDGVSLAEFETRDGQSGSIAVSCDSRNGVWRISGQPETAYFESLPYAD